MKKKNSMIEKMIGWEGVLNCRNGKAAKIIIIIVRIESQDEER